MKTTQLPKQHILGHEQNNELNENHFNKNRTYAALKILLTLNQAGKG